LVFNKLFMIRIGLECKVFCYDGTDIDAAEVGVIIPLTSCILRDFTFYSIDYISENSEDKSSTNLSSGDESFVVNEPYIELKKRIENLNFFINN